MSQIVFEDTPILVEEDKDVKDTSYDIVENKLITKKVIEKTTTSTIFNYADGISVYLKFDETGPNEMVELYFAIYSAGREKKIFSAPKEASLTLKRIDDEHFHLFVDDKENHAQNLVCVSINAVKDILITTINGNELIDYTRVDNMFALCVREDLDDNHSIFAIDIYQNSGKHKQTLFDKKIKNPDCTYHIETKDIGIGKVMVFAIRENAEGKRKVIKKTVIKCCPATMERLKKEFADRILKEKEEAILKREKAKQKRKKEIERIRAEREEAKRQKLEEIKKQKEQARLEAEKEEIRRKEEALAEKEEALAEKEKKIQEIQKKELKLQSKQEKVVKEEPPQEKPQKGKTVEEKMSKKTIPKKIIKINSENNLSKNKKDVKTHIDKGKISKDNKIDKQKEEKKNNFAKKTETNNNQKVKEKESVVKENKKQPPQKIKKENKK